MAVKEIANKWTVGGGKGERRMTTSHPTFKVVSVIPGTFLYFPALKASQDLRYPLPKHKLFTKHVRKHFDLAHLSVSEKRLPSGHYCQH